jgi:hypothetical protein
MENKLRTRVIKAILFTLITPVILPIILPFLYINKIKDIIKGK